MRFHGLITLSMVLCMSVAQGEVTQDWRFGAAAPVDGAFVDSVASTPAKVEGAIQFGGTAMEEAFLVDLNRNPMTVPYAEHKAGLPVDAISVETWVAVEKTVEWGQVMSAYRESGGFQKGWTLGMRQSNFSFGLSSEGKDDGDGRMTYVRALRSLEWGRWYHVVGTYDGAVQRLYMNGELVGEEKVQNGKILYPEEGEYKFGGGTDGGWRGWLHSARIHDVALSSDEIQARFASGKGTFPDALRVEVGPWVRRLDDDRIKISWKTADPSPSTVLIGSTFPLSGRVELSDLNTDHEVIVDGIEGETIYHYRVEFADGAGKKVQTRLYEFDSTFNYTVPALKVEPFGYKDDSEQLLWGEIAESILTESAVTQGYALVLGAGEGRLAYELAWRTELQVVCVEPDVAKARALRERLDDAGVYGIRVSVHSGDLESLSYNPHFANLIVSESMLTDGIIKENPKDWYALLRPDGGVAILGLLDSADNTPGQTDLATWLGKSGTTDWNYRTEGGVFASHHKPALAGIGEWTHQYGNTSNTASSGDLVVKGEMDAMWFGRPGPRPMVDRGTHNPAPLSANGRLFIQGDRRLFGMDAYNGTILWTVEIPDLRRANIPRDSTNMVLNGDELYIAVRDRCWSIDGQTGEILNTTPLSAITGDKDAENKWDWGYIATAGDTLFGSVVLQGGLYVGADGEWYDKRGEESEKVVSEGLFGINRHTGEKTWSYKGGLVMNSSISLGNGRAYFIETRSKEALASEQGRVGKEGEDDRFLISLDLETGAKVWERPFDMDDSDFVVYTMFKDDKLIALSSSNKWNLYAFNTSDGDIMYEHHFAWNRDHHGGAMQHPAIVGDKIYAEPRLIDLASGEVLRDDIPGRSGCGTVSASENMVLFRDGVHSMWDLEEDKRYRFKDFRPGCWLGMIPAGGMVLAPETSAGCWCASTPLQTSIAFAQMPGR